MRSAPKVKATQPTVLFLNPIMSRTNAFETEFLRRGWRVQTVNCGSWREALGQSRDYWRLVRSSRFVLAGCGFPSQIPLLLITWLSGRKLVIDCPMDITVSPFPEVWHWKMMLGFFFRRAHGFLTLASRDYLIAKFRLNRRRVLFVENCPDSERVKSSLRAKPRIRFDERPLIGYSGVALSQAIDEFVPTFKALLRRFPTAFLVVISDPGNPMILRLEQRAAELEVSHALRIVPVIHPYEEFIATVSQCDLWVSHMDNESVLGKHELRIELLEMGVLAKAVIAVSTPALEQHKFVDGENIILIDQRDPEASAEHIAAFICKEGELGRIGLNLSRHVHEKFSLSESIDRLLDFVGSGLSPHLN